MVGSRGVFGIGRVFMESVGDSIFDHVCMTFVSLFNLVPTHFVHVLEPGVESFLFRKCLYLAKRRTLPFHQRWSSSICLWS